MLTEGTGWRRPPGGIPRGFMHFEKKERVVAPQAGNSAAEEGKRIMVVSADRHGEEILRFRILSEAFRLPEFAKYSFEVDLSLVAGVVSGVVYHRAEEGSCERSARRMGVLDMDTLRRYREQPQVNAWPRLTPQPVPEILVGIIDKLVENNPAHEHNLGGSASLEAVNSFLLQVRQSITDAVV